MVREDDQVSSARMADRLGGGFCSKCLGIDFIYHQTPLDRSIRSVDWGVGWPECCGAATELEGEGGGGGGARYNLIFSCYHT